MRTYRVCWTLAVAAVTGVAAAVSLWVENPWLLLAAVLGMAAIGVIFGVTWEEDGDRRWATGRHWGWWGLVVAVMLTGLPPVLGAWSLLVVAGVGISHPALVKTLVRRWGGGRRPRLEGRVGELSDEQLVRLWRYSTLAVRSTWRTPVEILEVVQERERLLDEIERRDPDDFAQWLAGGRQTQER